MPRLRRGSLVAAMAAASLGLAADRAAGQPLDRAYPFAIGPVTLGGEVSAVLGPEDNTVFFNYTDYERNALRMARVRLAAQWRLHPALSVLGEVRAENFAAIDVTGLFVRWRPGALPGLTIQAGRVPPVIGAFPRRVYGRDNPLAGAPLGYQYLTSLRSDALPATPDDLLRMRGRGWRPSYPVGDPDVDTGIPLVNAARWDTGVEASWRNARWELAGALTRGAPAAPIVAGTTDGLQWSGRAAVRLESGLVAGISGARGTWIEARVLDEVGGDAAPASAQRVWGVDLEHGSGPWLLRGEWLWSSFDVPMRSAGPTVLDAHAGYAEVRYRPLPRWQVAGRAGRLGFGPLRAADAGVSHWDHPVTRLEGNVAFRVTRQLEVRGGWQHNWRHDGRGTDRGYPTLQVLYWF